MKTQGISEKEAEENVWKYAKNVGKTDVNDMVGKADRISGFFLHVEVLRKYMDDAATIFALIKDRVSGKYTHTPWRTVSALTAALLYVLAPLDAIADFIPLMGYVDDAAVFAFALNFARFDLEAYREWRKTCSTKKPDKPMAEREGFEPPVPCGTTVFKTAAIDHSATSPEKNTPSNN